MTALSPSPLQLQLTPMRIPEAVPADGMIRSNLQTAMQADGPQLLLRPGESSEMMVQLQNRSIQPLQIQARVEGNFPLGWCQVEGLETPELVPHQQKDVVLRFQVPNDFFEHHQALHPGKVMSLDYECRVLITGRVLPPRDAVEPSTESGNPTQAPLGVVPPIQAAFQLYVRPHSLYLDFLPNIYREVDFIGRFLKIFEQTFEPAVQTLDAMWANLDPLTAPHAMLPFLAYWVACPIDPRWSTERQRRLIRNAMELYRWRGTKRGLRLYLHLYTDLPLDEHLPHEADKHISITELAGSGFVLSNSSLGTEAMLGRGRPYHFIVQLRQQHPNQVDEDLVRQIIDQAKPAFCSYDLKIEG